MVKETVELGKRYFCREESSGEGHYGLFAISDDEIRAQLFSFDKHLFIDADEYLVLRLEDNRYASLHNNISSPGGSSYDLREPKLSTFSQRVISNIAVIGRDAWPSSDPIRRVQFTIEHADDLLLHTKKFDAIADAELGRITDSTIFEFEASGIRVAAWYTASGSLSFKRAQSIGVRYSIEFTEPASLNTYLTQTQCVVRFVSAALGRPFKPSAIEISRLSHAEFLDAVEAKKYLGGHTVHYIWPTEAIDGRLWVGHAFAHARNDTELSALVDCLKVWVERDPEWRSATNLMMGALKSSGEMTSERLLNACKWLEEIPGAASAIAVDDDDIDAIASCAADEAERRGHAGYKDRIAGVIRGQLKTESNAERFGRLQAEVRARFGGNALDDAALGHFLSAMKFRGRVAHGHFEPADENEFAAFSKAVYALEALCYLLTLKDLPMTDEGAKRAIGIEIASDYRHSIG